MSKNSKPVLNGVYEAISELIGFDNTVEIYKHFAGSQVNFPTRLFSKEFVLQEAIRNYDGTSASINKIAVKYKYSERTIRKLLQEHLESEDITECISSIKERKDLPVVPEICASIKMSPRSFA